MRYEFGCKVSVATTLDEGFVVGMRSFPGNPYDGHTLNEALEQVEIMTDQRPDLAVVDRRYSGYGVEAARVLISGTRRGLTPKLITDLRRHSAIEAEIGHMKTDGRLTSVHKRHGRGCHLRCPLCLRAQHPKDPGPPPGLACLDCRHHTERSLPPGSPVSGCNISLNELFKANYIIRTFGEDGRVMGRPWFVSRCRAEHRGSWRQIGQGSRRGATGGGSADLP